MNDEIHEIGRLIQELAARDVDRRVFGASNHQYRLFRPLGEPEVLAFEQTHGISLPPDYRRFLSTIGNGGAGPNYGLSPLGASSECRAPGKTFRWTKAVFLRDPSVIGLSGKDAEPFDIDRDDDADYEDYFVDGPPGAVHLSEMGCAYYSFLVVNGPAYGTVWNDLVAADCGLIPLRLPFLAWYRQWLDRCLARLAREPLVGRVTAGMSRTEMEDLLGTDFVETERRIEGHRVSETDVHYRDAAVAVSLRNGVVSRVTRLPI